MVAEWNANLAKLAMVQSANAKTCELIGEVSCRACGYVLGQLSQLCRHRDSYFLNQRDFYNRVDEKLFDTPEVYAKSTLTGNLCLLITYPTVLLFYIFQVKRIVEVKNVVLSSVIS